MANNLSANDFQLGVQVIPKTDQLNNEFKKISQTKSINVDVKIDGQSFKNVNKVVETYSNNLGTTQQKIRILNQENEEFEKDYERYENNPNIKPKNVGIPKYFEASDSNTCIIAIHGFSAAPMNGGIVIQWSTSG